MRFEICKPDGPAQGWLVQDFKQLKVWKSHALVLLAAES
jgi:hypothetical protein